MMGMHSSSLQLDLEPTASEARFSQLSWGSCALDINSTQLSIDSDVQHLLHSSEAASQQLADYLHLGAAETEAAAPAQFHIVRHNVPIRMSIGQSEVQQQAQHNVQHQEQPGLTYLALMQQQREQARVTDECQQTAAYHHCPNELQQPPMQVQQQPVQQGDQQQQQQQYQQLLQPLQASSLDSKIQLAGLVVPALNLSRVKTGSSSPVRNLADANSITEQAAKREEELCFEHSSMRQHQLHPQAPLQDSRCYIYQAVGRKELSDFRNLLSRLPERECGEVAALWDALMVARHDCEVMAARGVRVSRDISRDWQETVSDLIDRVVAQDHELGLLRQQLKAAQATTGSPSTGTPAAAEIEELRAHVVRLRRQRDRLSKDQQDLSQALAEAQHMAAQARQDAAVAKEQQLAERASAKALREQHADFLRQHIELATYAEGLEAALEAVHGGSAAAEADQDKPDQACKSPGGSFTTAKASSGRRSPFTGSCTPQGMLVQDTAPAGQRSLSLTRSLSGNRLALAGLSPAGRSHCTTPSPRTNHTGIAAVGRKLNMPPLPGLSCGWADRNSTTSSPVFGASSKAGAYAVQASGGVSAGCSTPVISGLQSRSSDDTPDTMQDRIAGIHPLIAASREVDQFEQLLQQPHTDLHHQVPLGVLGTNNSASPKTPSRLIMQRSMTPTVPMVKLGMLGAWGDGCRIDLKSTIESAMQQLESIEAMRCIDATL